MDLIDYILIYNFKVEKDVEKQKRIFFDFHQRWLPKISKIAKSNSKKAYFRFLGYQEEDIEQEIFTEILYFFQQLEIEYLRPSTALNYINTLIHNIIRSIVRNCYSKKRTFATFTNKEGKKCNRLPRIISLEQEVEDNYKHKTGEYKKLIKDASKEIEIKDFLHEIKDRLKKYLTQRQYEDFMYRRMEKKRSLQEINERWNCSASTLSHDYARNIKPVLEKVKQELLEDFQ